MDKFSYIANADTVVIDEMYQAYKANPTAVDSTWQQFFHGFEFSLAYGEHANGSATLANGAANSNGAANKTAVIPTDANVEKELKVYQLIRAYRSRGHLRAKTNPVRPRKDRKPRLELQDFGLTDADLDATFYAGNHLGVGTASLRKIVETLQRIYEGAIGFEYQYIREPEVQDWMRNKVENEYVNYVPSKDEKKRILYKLNEAVVFENFLHTKYVGQKRFSLEGGESTIPALDAIIQHGATLGAKEFVIGMAHRGRLNVLANVMGKTYEHIFNEFEGNVLPDTTMGDGDVKYHMGYSSEIPTANGSAFLRLLPNPSHLEAVNPVVIGYTRAKIDALYGNNFQSMIPILIHGDAAVAGQGIVYETTQMSGLAGYRVGGTIHFVINNQVGFTTDFEDARTAIYCTDVAKMVDAPVLHVNGDDPEAVVFAVKLAVEYRQKFEKDVFIDMVCYRRHGHNESDEPKFTQPTLYNIIAKHANPREVYNKKLIERGDVDAHLAESMDKEFRDMLQDRLTMVKQTPLPYTKQKLEQEWKELRRSTPSDFEKSPATYILQDVVDKVGAALTTVPESFRPLKQIEKLLKDRKKGIFEDKELNWATAELLAYGSMLLDNKIVRISGQDVQRGTFSHRHAVLRDSITSEPHNSLNFISDKQKFLAIHNSLLSEFAVLGFEFGYTLANPNSLVVWEAQFGDFANGSQTMIDQFISSCESKWNRMSGLVMLLPHGYEGQGPEHSNARPERFLQLCAEYNMVVANITQPANFFHFMRRQMAWEFRKPAIVMSPKSLLRHPKCVSPLGEIMEGGFKEVLGDNFAEASQVKKVILCSGKVYYDLAERQATENRKDVAIIRLEQLHPFPTAQLNAELQKYSNYKLLWTQEEPENMGYWGYILRYLRNTNIDVVARKPSASPATGYAKVHAIEQEAIVKKSFE
jgi:2-oxoglutarate dehydrogenase E1 component